MRRIAGLAGIAAGTIIAAVVAGSIALCSASLHVIPGASVSPKNLWKNPPGDWRDVSVRARDGAILVAWFVRPPEHTKNCVLVLHGIGDSRAGAAGFAPLFLNAGYNVLLPDNRGHGGSGGDIVTYGIREKFDVTSWIDWLHDQGCGKIFGLGESLGGAVLIQAAAVTGDLKAVAAECSYSDLVSVANYRVARMIGISAVSKPLAVIMVGIATEYAKLRYGIDLKDASPIDAIQHLHTSLLLIHGLSDTQTPPEESKRLAERNAQVALWLAPGARHVGAYASNPKEFEERVLGWFAQHRN